MLHGEQSVEIHYVLPVSADVTSRLKIDAIYDKGASKGAILVATRSIFEANHKLPLATLRSTYFLRGDGGFGGLSEGAPKPHQLPVDREPDIAVVTRTRIDQALVYRLSGDYNPLHEDPGVAQSAGFDGQYFMGCVPTASLAASCSKTSAETSSVPSNPLRYAFRARYSPVKRFARRYGTSGLASLEFARMWQIAI